MKNSVDPDQLASSEASLSGSTQLLKTGIELRKRYVYNAFIRVKSRIERVGIPIASNLLIRVKNKIRGDIHC